VSLANQSKGHSRLTVREARQQRRLQALYMQHVEPDPPAPPCGYGMTAEQLYEYRTWLMRECRWLEWELKTRFPDPREMAA
jgi:hypothetical protein